jgi:hypothetical protein
MNIYQKINEVMKVAVYLKKDLNVQGYAAVSHDAVTASLRQHMVEHGIVLTVSQISQKFDDREFIRDNPQKMRLYHGSYDVRFINAENPEDFIQVNVCAQAYDNGDKAPGKCISYATKYALLKTFMIETGVNEESRAYMPDVSIPKKKAGEKRLSKAEMKEKVKHTIDAIWQEFNSEACDNSAIMEALTELSDSPSEDFAGHSEKQIVWNFLPDEIKQHINEITEAA